MQAYLPNSKSPFLAILSTKPKPFFPQSTFALAALIFLGQRPSSILSMCLNHRNTLLSTFSGRVTSIPALIRISLFLILSHLVTPTISPRHLISNTFEKRLSVSLRPQVPAPLVTVVTITCWYIVSFSPQLIFLPFRMLLAAPSTLVLSKACYCTSASTSPTAVTSDPRYLNIPPPPTLGHPS